MTPSLKGQPTKVKEAPSPHEVILTPLETNPVFQCFGDKVKGAEVLLMENYEKLKIDRQIFYYIGFCNFLINVPRN